MRRVVTSRREAIAALLVIVSVGVLAATVVLNGRAADRQDAQICTAIPNAAAAGAQALIDILISDALHRGMPKERIANTERLGRLYVARARELALSDLPSCPKEPSP